MISDQGELNPRQAARESVIDPLTSFSSDSKSSSTRKANKLARVAPSIRARENKRMRFENEDQTISSADRCLSELQEAPH